MSTFTRYTKPIPEGVTVCDTYEQLVDVSRGHSNTHLSDEDGGYYIKDVDSGEIYAVASDALISELDRRVADSDARVATHPEERAPKDPEELEAWVAADPGLCTKADASSTGCDRDANTNADKKKDDKSQ